MENRFTLTASEKLENLSKVAKEKEKVYIRDLQDFAVFFYKNFEQENFTEIVKNCEFVLSLRRNDHFDFEKNTQVVF